MSRLPVILLYMVTGNKQYSSDGLKIKSSYIGTVSCQNGQCIEFLKAKLKKARFENEFHNLTKVIYSGNSFGS